MRVCVCYVSAYTNGVDECVYTLIRSLSDSERTVQAQLRKHAFCVSVCCFEPNARCLFILHASAHTKKKNVAQLDEQGTSKRAAFIVVPGDGGLGGEAKGTAEKNDVYTIWFPLPMRLLVVCVSEGTDQMYHTGIANNVNKLYSVSVVFFGSLSISFSLFRSVSLTISAVLFAVPFPSSFVNIKARLCVVFCLPHHATHELGLFGV